MLPELRLKKNEERRLRAGHLWVYSNEVDTAATPLKSLQAGQQVKVCDQRGNTLGFACVNPNTLICARLYSFGRHPQLDAGLIRARLALALAWRAEYFDASCYRWVYGESDGLPGLVVDRYFDVLVVQITSAGMELLKDSILDALTGLVKARVVLLKNDTPARELEGLASYTETAVGALPDTIDVVENQARFEVPLAKGQKTGWYYDHRLNRQRLSTYAKDKRILDVFSYVGAWGIQALSAGAKSLLCVDASNTFLDVALQNAKQNRYADAIETQAGDAFEVLKQLQTENRRFDIVILDPPAFIKRRKDIREGSQAYQRINRLAMKLLEPGGLLVSASCSHHLSAGQLESEIRKAAMKNRQPLQIIEQGHQGPDHPIHPAMPETEYLKAFFCRLLPGY
ncbi:MAG TPA: class I SAM-dependent rRNA methyltransferase [Gammaproteobacteria bacterium]|nr:class I SAM-dependent rRNA methyltransferase [Gammaproteobacteria bacterium]